MDMLTGRGGDDDDKHKKDDDDHEEKKGKRAQLDRLRIYLVI